MKKRKWILGVLMAGALFVVSPAQVLSPRNADMLRVREALQFSSPVGTLEGLQKVYKDTWQLDVKDDESQYLDAIAKGMLRTGDAELQLLKFIETYPHSSYINHAWAALGQLYYAKGQYGSAIYWLRQVDTSLLPERMGATVDYYHAYALFKEGRESEALKLFEPLTYYRGFKDDASFYAGYIQMKEGQVAKGARHMERVVNHSQYGTYANAYLAEARLTEMKYSEALSMAERGLQQRDLPTEVESSLNRTAGLSASSLGQLQSSVSYLKRYIQNTSTPGRVEQLVLGKNLFELGQNREAEQYLLSAAEGNSDFMSQLSLYYAGLTQLALKQPSKAISSFDRARSIAAYAPVTEASEFNGALAAYAQTPGRVGAGSQRLAKFLSTYSTSEYRKQVIGYLSDAYLNEPNAGAALAELNKMSPLPRELSRVRDRVKLKQANTLLTSGDTRLATQQYDEIIQGAQDPTSIAEAYLWKGEAAYRAKDYNTAISSTESYLKSRPSDLALNPNAYYTLGYAHYNLGQYGEAERYFKEYQQVNTAPTPEQKTVINNRLGDIEMQRKAYATAISFYNTAEQAGGSESDYALFSKAMARGLQKDYRDKADLMSSLAIRYPDSKLAAEAIYEQGRALALAGDNHKAQQAFESFFVRYKHHELASKVGLQMALSYYGDNKLDDAVRAYEMVVRQYPNSPEAKSALQDLKSISVQLNRVDSYSDLVKEVGATDITSHAEMDSLAFIAAERVVASGTPSEANRALDQYLNAYPNGAFVDNVYYNKALLQYNAKDYSGAVSTVASRAKNFSGKLADDTYRLLASCYDRLNEPGRAAEAYMSLALVSKNLGERSNWIRAAADRAETSGSADFLNSLAWQVADGKIAVNEEAKANVFLVAAKGYARNNQKQNALSYAKRVLALKDFGGHPIAETIVALDLYDKGEYKTVQSKIQKVVNKGTTDAYWLARAFVLLADSYEKLGDRDTARTYLESVRSSYTNSKDGIIKMIDERLARL